MSQIFISYAHEDAKVVEDLARSLQLQGWSVWWDKDIAGRSHFPAELEQQLNQASVVVVVWSSGAIKSRWVMEEANYALESSKIVPVLIDDSSPPFGFQLVDTISLRRWVAERRHSHLDQLFNRVLDYAPEDTKQTVLFGRTEELEAVRKSARSQAESTSATLVAGAAGVGKSVLIDEFCRIYQEEGARVFRARGIQGGVSPYQPLMEAIVPVVSDIDVPAEVREGLRNLFGEPRTRRKSIDDIDVDKQQILVRLTQLLGTLAEEAMVVLSIDDLQWMDAASVSVLDFLVSYAKSSNTKNRLVFLLSFRANRLTEQQRLLVDQIHLRDSSSHIQLQPLDDDASRELVERECGGRAAESFVSHVLSVSRGNPLFIRSLVQEARRNNHILWRHNHFTLIDDSLLDQIPADLAKAVFSRVASLEEQARMALEAAAVWGRNFGVGTIAKLLHRAPADVAASLDELEALELIEPQEFDYRIGHPLFQQVVYEGLSNSRKQVLHHGVALLLREQSADITLIAHHLVRSRDLIDRDELKESCRAAGNRAYQLHSWDMATQFLEFFIELEADSNVEGLAVAHHLVGTVCHRNGQPERAAQHYRHALDLSGEAGEYFDTVTVIDDLLRWHITYGSNSKAREEMMVRAEVCLDVEEDIPARQKGRLLETLSTAFGLRGDLQRARQCSDEAHQIATENDDHDLLARLSTATALPFLTEMKPEKAIAAWKDGVRYTEITNDHVRRVRCLHRLPMPQFMVGDFEALEADVADADALNYILPRSGEHSLALAALLNLHVLRGHWSSADDVFQRTVELILESDYYWATAFLLGAKARMRLYRGELDLLASDFSWIRSAAFRRQVEPFLRFAELYQRADYSGLAEALGERSDSSDMSLTSAPLTAMYLEACALTHECGDDEAMQIAALNQLTSNGVRNVLGWPMTVESLAGICHFRNGQLAEAARRFESAMTYADRIGANSEVVMALTYLSACDDAAGSSHGERASEAARRLGMSDYQASLAEALSRG